jgi:hypothetical protein
VKAENPRVSFFTPGGLSDRLTVTGNFPFVTTFQAIYNLMGYFKAIDYIYRILSPKKVFYAKFKNS